MLFIICGNGFAYAQTFNETPIPAFTLHKEMKTPQIFKLPEIKNTLSETNPAFNNSMPLVKQYELRKKFSYLDPVFTGYFNQTAYIYGQYRLDCNPNSGVQGFPLSPQSHYGASFRINLLERKEYGLDLNLGTDRSYNAATRQWENTYKIGPTIRLK